MIRKFTFLFLIIILSGSLYAQKDTVSYSVLEDNPYQISHVNLFVSPLYMKMDPTTYLSLGVEGGASIRIGKKVEASLLYQYSYLNLGSLMSDISSYGYDDLEAIKQQVPLSWAEVGVSWVFSDKVRKQPHYMNLHTQQTNQLIIYNVLSITSDLRRLQKVRGGVIHATNMEWMFPLLSSDAEQRYITTDGLEIASDEVVFPEIDYLNLWSYEGSSYKNENPYSDLMVNPAIPSTSNLIYIGYASEKIINTLIDVENHGIRSKRGSSEFFVDLIVGKVNYAPFEFYTANTSAVNYNDEVSNETKLYELDEDLSGIKANNFGFRMGWMIKSPAFSNLIKWEEKVNSDQRLMYPYFRTSFGMLPTMRLSNSYFWDFSFGFSLNL